MLTYDSTLMHHVADVVFIFKYNSLSPCMVKWHYARSYCGSQPKNMWGLGQQPGGGAEEDTTCHSKVQLHCYGEWCHSRRASPCPHFRCSSWLVCLQDTEFPGVVARPIGEFRSNADYQYQLLRCNVDLLKIIQLGLTFMNEQGDYPPGTSTWQFNFKFNLT